MQALTLTTLTLANSGACNLDAIAFKGIFVQHLRYMLESSARLRGSSQGGAEADHDADDDDDAGGEDDALRAEVARNAASLWGSARDNATGMCGVLWQGPYSAPLDPSMGPGGEATRGAACVAQVSALACLAADIEPGAGS